MHCVHQNVLNVIGSVGSNVERLPEQRKASMFAALIKPTENQTGGLSPRIDKHRLRIAVASLTAALMLSACGGGGDISFPADFNIGVTVGGQFVSQTPVPPGGSLNLAIRAGQSLILDAGEPVVWTLLVGGSSVSGGAQVFFAGANITATTLNPSTVAVDTSAAFLLRAPVPVTLVATSTFDSFQVATVNLLITN
jgi:hypothetical protein